MPVTMILYFNRREVGEAVAIRQLVGHQRGGARGSTKHCSCLWWGGREKGLTESILCFRYVTALKILSKKYVFTSRALKYNCPSWLMHKLKNMTKCTKASTSWCECFGVSVRGLDFINAVLDLALLFIPFGFRKTKALSVNKYRYYLSERRMRKLDTEAYGWWFRDRVCGVGKSVLDTSMSDVLLHTPRSVFTSVLLLV